MKLLFIEQRPLKLSQGTTTHNLVIFAFAVVVGTLSWQYMPEGGLDMRDDIIPSLFAWRQPWAEGTPLFPWAVIILMPLRFFYPTMGNGNC